MHWNRYSAVTGRRTTANARHASIVVVALAFTVVACSSSPTPSQFASQANSICQTYKSSLKSAISKLALSTGEDPKQLERALSGDLTALTQGSMKLKALSEPAGETAALAKAFRSQDAQIADLKKLLAAMKQRNAASVEAASAAFGGSEAPLNQQFNVLGLTDCGSGSSVVPPSRTN